MKTIHMIEPVEEKHQCIETEQGLLGYLIMENKTIHLVADKLHSVMFIEPLHQMLYTAMLQISGNGHPVDQLTLAAHLAGAAEPFASVGGVASYAMRLAQSSYYVLDHEPYVDMVAQMHKRRQSKVIMQEAINRIDSNLGMYDDVLAVLEHMNAQLDAIGSTGRLPHYSSEIAMNDLLSWMKREDGGEYSTGLARLDRAMGGGMAQGRVYGIVAPAKAGKTMLAGTISNALVANGVCHAYLCLEMQPKMEHISTILNRITLQANQRMTERQGNAHDRSDQAGYGNKQLCHEIYTRVCNSIWHEPDIRHKR
jgi:replicative DNA helicase